MTKSYSKSLVIYFLISIFYAYQFLLRNIPNVMMLDIMSLYQIDAVQFGKMNALYYVGYSLVHLPLGLWLDQYGPRKVVSACLGLIIIGLLPFTYALNFSYPIIGRLLIGMGSSAAILGSFKIIRMIFPVERFTRMLSFTVMIGLLGSLFAGVPVYYLLNTIGYQKTIISFIAFAFVLMSLILYYFPDVKDTQSSSTTSSLKDILKHPKALIICFLAGLMVSPLEGFADALATQFLRVVYQLPPVTATALPSAILIGFFFGSPLVSYISEYTKKPLNTLIGCCMLMAGSFSILIQFKLTVPVVAFVFFLIGVGCAYQIIAIYLASLYVDSKHAGFMTAIANMIIMLFGSFFHLMIGHTINFYGGPHDHDALVKGAAIVPIGLWIAFVGLVVFSTFKSNRIEIKK